MRLLFLFSVWQLLGVSGFAHDAWLLARKGTVKKGEAARLVLASGSAFARADKGVSPDRVERAVANLGGHDIALEARKSADGKTAEFSVKFDATGLALCYAVLKPKTLELTPAEARQYLDEIDAPNSLKQIWKTPRTKLRWRENQVKYAKTFVCAGNPDEALKGDSLWAEPIGIAFEIVPDTHPLQLRAGESASARLFKNGKPLAGFPIGVEMENGKKQAFVARTDSKGRASFIFSKPGKWILRATEVRSSNRPDLEYESDCATLTFEVRK